ncbi:MAG: cytochrome o ubiquinol oxidase subunit III [Chlamydiales bacterium]
MTHALEIHHEPEAHPDISLPDPHQDTYSKTTLGFWIYLMTDCLIFGTLFCAYAVLHPHTFGGPSTKEIFSLRTAFIETMFLLFSSISCGFAILSSRRKEIKPILFWLAVTFLLGGGFISMELNEFYGLIREGNSWQRSAFLSSFFALVGTHGLHVSIGLFWLLFMVAQLLYFGLTSFTFHRLVLFNMFWHFLDVVWIFIFSFVYLIGVV